MISESTEPGMRAAFVSTNRTTSGKFLCCDFAGCLCGIMPPK